MSVWAGAMSDPRDIDEDAILKGLSAEELDQLEYELQEMDPEVIIEIYIFVTYWFLVKWIFFWLLLLEAEANK